MSIKYICPHISEGSRVQPTIHSDNIHFSHTEQQQQQQKHFCYNTRYVKKKNVWKIQWQNTTNKKFISILKSKGGCMYSLDQWWNGACVCAVNVSKAVDDDDTYLNWTFTAYRTHYHSFHYNLSVFFSLLLIFLLLILYCSVVWAGNVSSVYVYNFISCSAFLVCDFFFSVVVVNVGCCCFVLLHFISALGWYKQVH